LLKDDLILFFSVVNFKHSKMHKTKLKDLYTRSKIH